MKRNITKRLVESLKPGETAWDAAVPGFGVRRRASGRIYLVKYGTGVRGRSRWLTLGVHGGPWVRQGRACTLTADLAREEALRLLGEKAAGRDPAAVRDANRSVPTVAGLAARFLEEYVSPFKKPTTVIEYGRLLSKVIVPALGRLRLDHLLSSDVAAFHHDLRRKPTEANRSVAVLSKMLSWAEAIGVRPKGSNVASKLPRYRETRRERFLSQVELGRLGAALAEAEHANPMGVAIIRLLLFSGARLSEILSLEWAAVDLAGGVARLSDSKTGQKTIQLNAPARAVLAALPRLSGSPFCFPASRGNGHFIGIQPIWARIRSAALLQNVRLHDLRHSFASVAVSGGASLPLIGGLLGHSNPSTTQRYAHLSESPLRDVAERVGERIENAMRVKAK